MFQSDNAIRANLEQVARLLAEKAPDVVALQEADGPSFWSGRFDHVQYVAKRAGYPHVFRGSHMHSPQLDYGTALLSRFPLQRARSVAFAASPPTPSKGFVFAEVVLPPAESEDRQHVVGVVSVHLDFLRRSVREQQIRRLVEHLKSVSHPLIVMGDFNCEWSDEEDAVRILARELDLRPYEPDQDFVTFPGTGTRLDWVLVSRQLVFESYEVLPERVSDHLALAATITYANSEIPGP